MGYRGKLAEQEAARGLRAQGWTLLEIATELGVAKSSVSLWVRDVAFVPRRPSGSPDRKRGLHPQRIAKLREIDALDREGIARVGIMSDQAFLVAGAALYAGEGSKTDGQVLFPNSDPRMIAFFCAWLRRFFDIDESRLRLRLYLHQGLDLDAATAFWAELTGIPPEQHTKPYRAVPDPSIRHAKHPMGCPAVRYGCARTHRAVMGLVRALLSSEALPG
jgi:hypothetical protein